MRNILKALSIICLPAIWLVAAPVTAESTEPALRLAKIFADNMLLQRELPVAVWGWAGPGKRITVEFNGQSVETVAGDNGKWSLKLSPMKSDGRPHTLTARSGDDVIRLKNILLGEVWLASGQSNMGRSVKIQESHPDIRLFWRCPKVPGIVPQKEEYDGQAGWCESSPEALAELPPRLTSRGEVPHDSFGEVAYVFGRKIHEELNVPVGLIHRAWAGSTAKAWIPVPGIEKEFPFGQKVEGRYLGHKPGLLYQSKILPMMPFTIRGVIWYQGEDDGRNRSYRQDLTALIESWRRLWGRRDMPFYFVQIAQTTYASGMLGIWEAQSQVMHSVPHTGLAVSNDIYPEDKVRIDEGNNRRVGTGWPITGNSNPHPPNKQLVANRLADIALVKTYGGSDRVIFGPMYDSHEIKQDRMLVKFRFAGAGLATYDKKAPNWFEISDGTKEGRKLKYVKAQAEIVAKDTVAVFAAQIKEPKFVRFAWYSLARHNLINKEGLPAVSFRTDSEAR